jgi:uncharacterized membrane protein
MKAARVAFTLLLVLSVAQIAYHYPRLPDRLASHFNAAGDADGFVGKNGFLGLHLGALALVAAIFLVLPGFLHWIPPSWISHPRKDYWFAPERRQVSIERLGRQLTWFGVPVLLFLLLVMELVIRANLPGGGARIDSRVLWAALGAYLLLLVAWLIWTVVPLFRVPGEDAGRSP